RRWIVVGPPGDLHQLQQLVDTLADVGARALAHLQPEGDVLADGHVLERGVVLEDEADDAHLRASPRFCGTSRVTSTPSSSTVPDSGRSRPAITRRRVDFPLPLGPRSAVSEPDGTSIDASSSATNSPNRFVTDLATMAISAPPPWA